MIRVLHVIGSLDMGGSQTMILNLYKNIDRNRIQFDFVVREGKRYYLEGEIECLGGKIYRLPSLNACNFIGYVNAWKRFFSDHPEYLIVHGHVRSTAAIYLKIAKSYGRFTIAHSHNTSSGTGAKAIIKNILQFPLRYVSDYYFACSLEAGNWLFGKRITSSKKFKILKNAIETEDYLYSKKSRDTIRANLDINENAFVVGNVSRFHPQKNHMFLIDIFKEIHKINNDSVLLLVGDGELRSEIERRISDLGLSHNVILTGIRDDVPQIMSAMDVFVFPSVFEGLGIVAIEAQAAGLQTICSDSVPQEANVTGLFHSIPLKRSADEWAKNIVKYNNGYDRENTYEKVVRAGYDINNSAVWLRNFYERINRKIEIGR